MTATSHKMMKSSVHWALNAIGDRWNYLIIQEAFRGLSRYEELREATGASRNTLLAYRFVEVRHRTPGADVHRDRSREI